MNIIPVIFLSKTDYTCHILIAAEIYGISYISAEQDCIEQDSKTAFLLSKNA